jgi:hypothetical protein
MEVCIVRSIHMASYLPAGQSSSGIGECSPR